MFSIIISSATMLGSYTVALAETVLNLIIIIYYTQYKIWLNAACNFENTMKSCTLSLIKVHKL